MPATVPTGGQGATGLGGLAALTDVLASAGTVLPAVGGPVVVAGTLNVLVGTPLPPAGQPTPEVRDTSGLTSAGRFARSKYVLRKDETTSGFLARYAPLGAPQPAEATEATPQPVMAPAPAPGRARLVEVGPPADIPAALVRIDASWRFHDTDLLTALGWAPGTALVFTRTSTGALIRRAGQHTPDGAHASQVDARGRVLLPRRLRRMLRLTPHTPLLILADLGESSATLATLPTIATALKETA